MIVTYIQIQVKPESIEAFKLASVENARQSVQEPGIARFDILQSPDDPARFIFVEAYRTPDAPADHRATRHYEVWRDTVAPMMAQDRVRASYTNVFPEDSGW